MLDADGRPIELGRGAMGLIYKALGVDLRCLVTIKVISERYLGDESARLRFLREARAAAKVRHSNVASVLHLGRTGNSYFYAIQSCFTVEIPGYLERGAMAVEPPFLPL